MARRKIEDRHIRTLAKGATSYYITLPIEAVRGLGWKQRQKLVVDIDYNHEELVIRDHKR
jgi:bifunctional DNA-binding transcriptional regulator/antitoxin component of YhaV-PrlF toxin-antitoxin module